MAMVSGLNAKRFAGKPLRQPVYSFKDIPRCSKDLQGSSLQEVNDREHIKDAMAEMVLLCNETMRRLHIEQKVGKRTAKPLSLEYIADRLDIDDPLFGYFVRTDSPSNVNDDKWKKGMLQGFITVTTFTNWQKTFRWDSMHDSAFAYDDDALAAAMASGVRQYDEDGTLAEALQSTVRCGDPWNEGIVWPRIAEISLLGGMGCGKALVSLVIEKLECMTPNNKRNYDYVTLQATENSIPFYESLGFVRVGGITEDEKYEEKQAKLRGEETPSPDSPPETLPPQSEIVSSSIDVYKTKVAGETPADIAKKLKVDVWDVIFLNHYVYPDIATRSRLMKGTSLYVPAAGDGQVKASSRATRSQGPVPAAEPSAPQWYIAEENDTPRMIASQFDVSCTELVKANRGRLPELQWQSRLKEGTRIKVSHFHVDDDKHVPYCHWTFPDDSFETSEPSYMMVRKLNRRKGPRAKVKHVEASLAVSVTEYTAPPSELFNEVQPSPAPDAKGKTPKSSKKHPAEPKKPKRPLGSYMIYCNEQRELMQDDFVGMKGSEVMKIVSKMWRELPDCDKAPYQEKQAKLLSRYRKAMEKYESDLASFYDANPQLKPAADATDAKSQTLFNKVVKLNAEGMAQTGSEHEYYFVLTYIPDLCWAHLAPLECVGLWGPDKPQCEGRPVWMLVDEKEGKEVDISGSFCVPVRSRALKRTADADCEQWDIIDPEDTTPISARKFRPPRSRANGNQGSSKKRGRPRKHPLPGSSAKKSTPGSKRKGGRPPKYHHSATKPLSGSKLFRCEQTGNYRRPRGRAPYGHEWDEKVGVWRPSGTGIAESDSQSESPAVAKRRGPPQKQQQYAATKPLTGSIEVKKRGRRQRPLPESDAGKHSPLTGFVRPKKRGTLPEPDAKRSVSPTRTLSGGRRIGSETKDDDWELQTRKPAGKKRGRTPKRRGRRPRQSLEQVDPGLTDEEDSRPAKRRRLPRRDVASVAGSYQDVEHSDIDEMATTPAKRTPRKRGKTSTPSAAPEWGTPDAQQGSSPFRTVALTRSAEKLSMASPLMFSRSPRRTRLRG